MSQEVYQIPDDDRIIKPVEVVEHIANVTEDVAALVKTHEAKMHMLEALKRLRFAAAAERQTMGVVS